MVFHSKKNMPEYRQTDIDPFTGVYGYKRCIDYFTIGNPRLLPQGRLKKVLKILFPSPIFSKLLKKKLYTKKTWYKYKLLFGTYLIRSVCFCLVLYSFLFLSPFVYFLSLFLALYHLTQYLALHHQIGISRRSHRVILYQHALSGNTGVHKQ